MTLFIPQMNRPAEKCVAQKKEELNQPYKLEEIIAEEPFEGVLKPGLEGIKLTSGEVFFPGELLSQGVVKNSGKVKLKTKGASKIKTEAFWVEGEKKTPLYRGHKLFSDFTKEQLKEAAILAGEYLLTHIDPSGKFLYSYRPKKDRYKDAYNILRHSGTIYAMLELYELTKDEALVDASSRALDYLYSHKHGQVIVEKGFVKLGANALAVLATCKFCQVTGKHQRLAEATPLAEWMIRSMSEKGEFLIHKQAIPSLALTTWRSLYYPGEALFSLSRLDDLMPGLKLMQYVERGAHYLIKEQVKLGSKLPHDHWFLYALGELHQKCPNPKYLNHAKRIAGAIIKAQHKEAEELDWIGGFYRPPRTTPTTIRMEGLIAAYPMVKEMEGYLETVNRGIAFSLQNQFTCVSALHLKNPQAAIGGVRASLTNYEIRIDYVQHFLSAILGYLKIMQEN